MNPSTMQVAAAVETLMNAGWSLSPPVEERLRLLDPDQVAEAVGCGDKKAREIILSLPHSVRLPGGELRARPADLERWMKDHEVQR